MKLADLGLRKAPPATRQAWLDQLGKALTGYFLAGQILDILSDYAGRLQEAWERTRSEEAVLKAADAPEEAAARLLEEEPAAGRLRRWALWGAALLLCCGGLRVCLASAAPAVFWTGSCLFLPLAGSALFLLLQGPDRVEIEGRFPPEGTASPVPVYCVPFALTAAYEAVEQLLAAALGAGWIPPAAVPLDELNTCFLLALELVLLLLAAWLLLRSVTASIRYFPGVLHTVGAGGTLFYSYLFFTSTNVETPWGISLALPLRLLPYCAGLASALVFQRWVDGCAPLPRCFLDASLTRRGWLHRLGQRLLAWFPAGQALEVLEDYREQFDLGAERGRSDAELIFHIGRPETVVRDLIREAPGARLYRRRSLRWALPLAAGVWLLLQVFRTYTGSNTGHLYRWYTPQIAALALPLAAVPLFALVHGRGRSLLEARFPAERGPTLWPVLLPLTATALTAGGGAYLIRRADDFPALLKLFTGLSVADLVALSVLLLAVVLVWTLSRCFSGSIRYFPAALHAAGSMACVLCAGTFLHGIDVEYATVCWHAAIRGYLLNLLPYLAGLLLALAFRWVIRRSGSEGGEG